MIAALAVVAVLTVAPAPAHAVAAPADRGPYVFVEQSGGFAGWTTQLTIRPNGTATVVDHGGVRHRYNLTAKEQRRLAHRLTAADLPEIAGRYTTPGAADLFVYRIVSSGTQVVADQLAIPAQAEPLVRTLTRLMSPSRWDASSTGG